MTDTVVLRMFRSWTGASTWNQPFELECVDVGGLDSGGVGSEKVEWDGGRGLVNTDSGVRETGRVPLASLGRLLELSVGRLLVGWRWEGGWRVADWLLSGALLLRSNSDILL